ncbi:GAF domain-containing protein [Coleofasciculus sp. FACHB-1120]|uniref:GAF domain-containing protein n=1 Tax=Coleofasciculus sp. FACHB-1120 TaxID=2692783 RepID=UPI00168482B6|nr:GAF domain-containing protein [Coleofasciculus sp. FACHB-1120]MBD2740911.1 GAF domain-containing protein [Coleofasciculus sp. FACHB-1120]
MNITCHESDSSLVLIVDDDRFTRMQLRGMMEQEGYTVVEASDGEEGLAVYMSLHPDIVLLDALMPIMDGFTCCSQLRSLPQGDRTPVLIITSLDDRESVNQAFEAGATDYVTKPVHWAVLRQRMRRLLQASRATEELRQQNQQQRLMGAMLERIRQSLNLEEILSTTANEVRQFLQTDRVIIYRFNPDWSGIVEVESVDERWTAILGQTILDPCFASSYVEPYKHGRIRATEDIHNAGLKQCYIDLVSQLQVKANLVVPILQNRAEGQELKTEEGESGSSQPLPLSTDNTELWGLLIAHHCSQPRQWQAWEIDFLSALATQVAIAIQQSELYQQVQRLNTNLEHQVQERTSQLQQALKFEAMLKRITDKVRDSLDESHILQTAVQELAQVLAVKYCDTALYDINGATSTVCYEYTLSMPSSEGSEIQMASNPAIYSQLLQGKYLQFCKLGPNPIQPNSGQFSVLACPIFDNQGVLGDLWLLNDREYIFNDLEIRLLQQVANQCAIAIRQARLYQASLTQVEELEKLNQLKDDFLSTVSHELRTPVSNMKMAIQMLEVLMEKKDDWCENHIINQNPENHPAYRYFTLLNDECDREMNLINDLLHLQQLNAGAHPLEKTTIRLQDWIPHIIEPFEQRTQKYKQILQVDIPEELPILVSDPFSLARILTELLTNACKYTPPEEKITIAVRAKSEILQICVTNSGIEIPTNEISRIFDKFYRIPSHDPWKHGGTGLGLALVQKMVAYLGGVIKVQSTSENTCFLVELPIA